MPDIEDIITYPTPLVPWNHPLFEEKELEVWVKRDDLSHPVLSGNKFRKLQYSLKNASLQGYSKLLSFGGAFSNHLYAMAGVAKYLDFEVKMIIRGEELHIKSNETLAFAHANGVKLQFVERSEYKVKDQFQDQNYFTIPEGGSSFYCLQGMKEMVDEILTVLNPHFILTSAGTGGTAAGILSNSRFEGKVVAVSTLKGGAFLRQSIKDLYPKDENLLLWQDYHFGGYAKNTNELEKFISAMPFPLEHVYTGKMFYAFWDQMLKNFFPPKTKIVLYHSGGIK